MDRQTGSNDANSARLELSRLMQRVADKDPDALRAVYDLTSAKLYGISLHLLHDEAEAQDVLQDVFVTVWRKASLFDPAKAGVMTWLATLARNRSIDRLRRRHIPAEGLAAAAEIADDGLSSAELLERAEDATRLHRCLEELDERARTMIRTAFFEGATYRQLAERATVPLPTVKGWIRRGLQRLRGCLER